MRLSGGWPSSCIGARLSDSLSPIPGRAIKEKLEPEQLQAIKEMKGLPLVDK